MKQSYNYYEILEIKTSAPQNEISQAYERVRGIYSNENPAIYTIFSEQEAREYLKLIDEAYSVLSNKMLRTIYDQKLLTGAPSQELKYENIVREGRQKQPQNQMLSGIQTSEIKLDPSFEVDINACTEWTGSFLKKVREYKGLSVERVGQITKINPYYIRAIENVEQSQLPAPVFVRGYVMQIAKTLKLDEKKVADSYMKIYKNLESEKSKN